jgi:hypothetical protein
MDEQTYATVTDVCARLTGRLTDDTIRSVREDYFGGESLQAETTLLMSLAYERVGITPEEHTLIQSTLDDPDNPDLAAVTTIPEHPAVPYHFSPIAGPHAPSPTAADAVLMDEAPRHHGRRLRRTWRTPLNGAPDNTPTWVYVLQIAPPGNELRAFSAMASRLWVTLHEKWPVEVVTEGKLLPPYQAAALTAAHQIWSS